MLSFLKLANTNNMAFKPEQPKFKERELVPAGTHAARLISLVDLGIQQGEFKGVPTSQHKVYLTWELGNEMREFDGLQKPMVIGKEFTFSMAPKARLRPVVEGLVGVKFTDPEAYNFDFEETNLLGTECMISVSHIEGKKGVYAAIESVVPIMKGVTVPPQFNDSTFYLLTHGGNEVYEGLPKFLKEKIEKSRSEQTVDSETALKLAQARQAHNKNDFGDDAINPEDIPF